ncbi:PH domain-containing protein [Candidatus Microgenomates bacterium]|nr:PH domain-containing protein [Candidatus Microgenomates bacterium]
MAHQPVIELDPDERLLRTVKRTLVGLIPRIAIGLFVLVGVLLAVFLIARFREEVTRSLPIGAALAIVILLALLVALMLYLSIVIYLRNQILITNERVVSVLQRSLFARDVIQLRLGDVQEIRVKQTNFFENLFNFGIIDIQTAAELDNVTFVLAKDPYSASKIIDDAKEEFERAQGGGGSP